MKESAGALAVRLFVWSLLNSKRLPQSDPKANHPWIQNTRSRRANPPLLAVMVLSSRCSTSRRHIHFWQLLAPCFVAHATSTWSDLQQPKRPVEEVSEMRAALACNVCRWEGDPFSGGSSRSAERGSCTRPRKDDAWLLIRFRGAM